MLLLFADGSKQFWADRTAVSVEKTYSKPQTIAGLRRFAADLRDGKIRTCAMCGSPSCDGARGGHCEED